VVESGSDDLEPGDRVALTKDVDTTQGVHVPKGSTGTVAEDRGSRVVVFFDDEPAVTSFDGRDLKKLETPPPADAAALDGTDLEARADTATGSEGTR
jgi:hypothetical protein